ncbi:MAG: hypothetical protein IJA10_13450 [Lachnospiraceae bacterium]|nr:hypothetical protein [Lachnospiraceae bacterium]
MISLTEYDKELHEQTLKEESWEDGWNDGMEVGVETGERNRKFAVKHLLWKKLPPKGVKSLKVL